MPAEFDPPNAREVQLAYYREVGRPNPDGSDSVLMHHPFEELMNQLGGVFKHDYEFEIKNVEVLATLNSRNRAQARLVKISRDPRNYSIKLYTLKDSIPLSQSMPRDARIRATSWSIVTARGR